MISRSVALIPALLLAIGAGVSQFPAPAEAAQAAPGPIIALPNFPTALPEFITLPCCRCADGSTLTVDISTGTAPWYVGGPNARLEPAVRVDNTPGSWTTALAPAQWMGHASADASGSAPGNYIFVLQFRPQRCLIPATSVRLTGRSAADNKQIVSLGGNLLHTGTTLAAYQAPAGNGFTTANIKSFVAPPPDMTKGPVYTLRVVVTNLNGPSGLALRGALTIACPDNPVLP